MAKLSPSWDMGIWNSELPRPKSKGLLPRRQGPLGGQVLLSSQRDSSPRIQSHGRVHRLCSESEAS